MATAYSRSSVVDIEGMTAAEAATAINAAIELLEAAGFVVTEIKHQRGVRGGLPKHDVIMLGKLAAYAGDSEAVGLVKVATLSVGHADLTDADTSQAISWASAIPLNALILGTRVGLGTVFSGGSVSALSVKIGFPGDTDCLLTAADLMTAAVDGEASSHTVGVAPNRRATGDATARTPVATFDSTTDNLVNLTAGACTLEILYT